MSLLSQSGADTWSVKGTDGEIGVVRRYAYNKADAVAAGRPLVWFEIIVWQVGPPTVAGSTLTLADAEILAASVACSHGYIVQAHLTYA